MLDQFCGTYMKSQYLSTVMSVADFSQWDFFHIKTRSSDGRKPENLQLVTKSTGKKRERILVYFVCTWLWIKLLCLSVLYKYFVIFLVMKTIWCMFYSVICKLKISEITSYFFRRSQLYINVCSCFLCISWPVFMLVCLLWIVLFLFCTCKLLYHVYYYIFFPWKLRNAIYLKVIVIIWC